MADAETPDQEEDIWQIDPKRLLQDAEEFRRAARKINENPDDPLADVLSKAMKAAAAACEAQARDNAANDEVQMSEGGDVYVNRGFGAPQAG